MLAAVKLYELGRLSSGRAAELADMSRVEFLLNLGRYRVFPFEAELSDLEALSSGPKARPSLAQGNALGMRPG